MANIKDKLNNIKNALFGHEVRGSIHDGIEAINEEVENTTSRQVDLESTFDELVINAGNSNAEIVDARVQADGTAHKKLGDRLNKVDSQIKENEKFSHTLIRKNISHNSKNTPVITFIDDDNNSAFLTLIKPIFDKYNIKGSLAIVTDTVGKEGYLTENQLMDLQSQGYTIMSHSKSHDANVFKGSVVDLGTVNSAKILNEYRESYNWLASRGFKGADTIVYPWGNFGEHSKKYKELARNFYNNGVNASGGLISNSPNDNMYLSRQFVQSSVNLDTYKTLIDECIKNNSWLILGTHSNTNEIDSSHFESVVRYAVNSGASILPFIEANEVKGNALSIGEYENENSIYISKNGNVKAINLQNCKVYTYDQTRELSMDILPSEFDKGIHSFCIRNSNDSLTGQGGNLILHNNGGDFIYETYVPFNSVDMYIRRFDFRSQPNQWSKWELANGKPKEYNTTPLSEIYTTSTVHIKKDINTVVGTIRLVSESKTGSFQHNTQLVKINGLTIPHSAIVLCAITTGDGEVLTGALDTYPASGDTYFKCHGTINKNNIRWIDINFSFNIYM